MRNIKKNNLRKRVALLLAVAAIIPALASCGGYGGNGGETEAKDVETVSLNEGNGGYEMIERDDVTYTRDNLDLYGTPEWWRDAKFGIFIHYGVYSVPAYGDEWYGHWMYMKGTSSYGGSDIYSYHKGKYGGADKFGYKDFIPDFLTALKKGASENMAEDWAQLFYDAGAKYVMPVGIHHDSFALFDSDVQTTYNSVNLAGIDYIENLMNAVRGKGMKFGISNHFAENDWFFDDAAGAGTDVADKAYSELYGTGGSKTESHVRKWFDISMEIINKYHPDIIYYDFDLSNAAFDRYKDANRYLMLENYYNLSKAWEGCEGVVCNFKNTAFTAAQAVLNSERAALGYIDPTPWQTDTSVGRKSWCYTTDEEYRPGSDFIGALVDIVSKNGNLLLNVGPRADGTIPDECRRALLDIGAWLAKYGDAVYATRPWLVYGEGPTKNSGDNYKYNERDIRFTRSKDKTKLYVTSLSAPKLSQMSVKTLKKGAWDASRVDKICLINGEERIPLEWEQTEDALVISLPKEGKPDTAYSVEITFKNGGVIPSLAFDAGDIIDSVNYESGKGLALTVAEEDGSDAIVGNAPGAYAKYLLNFDKNSTGFLASVSAASAGTLTVRDGSPEGEVLLTLDIKSGDEGYGFVCGDIKAIEGEHEIYLTFDGKIELNWFSFVKRKGINEKIEAEDYDAKSGSVRAEECSDEGGGKNLGYVTTGTDYVMYSRVDFGKGCNTLYMRMAGDGQMCNVRIDSPKGKIIATTGEVRTGGWTKYSTFEYQINGVEGVHDVYITYDTARSDLNINWFSFSDGSYVPSGVTKNPDSRDKGLGVKFGAEFYDGKYGSVTAESCTDEKGAQNLGYVAAGDWVMYEGFDFGDGADKISMRLAGYGSALEIRLDSKDGELLAGFSPSTGGWSSYKTFESALSLTVSGKHDIYIVFRGSANVNWFTFTKG